MKQIPVIYVAAVKKKPSDDNVLPHLLMDNVRTEEYMKQKQATLALHNIVPSNPYNSRAVMSIVMQVHAILILYTYVCDQVAESILSMCIQFCKYIESQCRFGVSC